MKLCRQSAWLLILVLVLQGASHVQQPAITGSGTRHNDVVKGALQGASQGLVSLTETEESDGEVVTLAEGEVGSERNEGEAAEEGEEDSKGKEGEDRKGGENGKEGAESEKGAEGEEEEEEEEEFTEVDIHVACMLLGGVAFIILLFMLVLYEDDDIRRYAWTLVSSVTSIFVAVMVFGAVNAWVLLLCERHEFSAHHVCAVQYVHLLVWICSLQLVLAITSGTIGEGPDHKLDLEEWVMADGLRADYGEVVDEAVCTVRNKSGKKSVIVKRGLEVPVELVEKRLQVRERHVKCWATLMAHMSGFASINSGNTMQHLPMFCGSPIMTIVPLLFNQAFVSSLFIIFDKMRARLNAEAIAAGRAGKRAAMFDEEAEEAENDISCLAGSYLIVQTIRFACVGRLPNMIGDQEGPAPWDAIGHQLGVAFAMFCCAPLLTVLRSQLHPKGVTARLLLIVGGMSGMGFAWACLFSSRTMLRQTPYMAARGIGMATVSGRILLALGLSLLCTGAIFLLDVVGDAAKKRSPPGRNLGAEIITQIVAAKSILVGFSWEHAFDAGVEAVASTTSTPHITQTVIATAVFFLLVPAWRRHILRKQMMLQAYYAEQEAADIENTKKWSSPRELERQVDAYERIAADSRPA